MVLQQQKRMTQGCARDVGIRRKLLDTALDNAWKSSELLYTQLSCLHLTRFVLLLYLR